MNHPDARKVVQGKCYDYYQPYSWRVHFKPLNKDTIGNQGPTFDTYLYCTPDGTPCEFIQDVYNYKRSQQTPILPQQEAQQKAEHQAAHVWGINFAQYILEEVIPATTASDSTSTAPETPDYTFIYRRIDAHIANGSYNLRIALLGNKLVELIYTIDIPKDFLQSYQKIERQKKLLLGSVEFLS